MHVLSAIVAVIGGLTILVLRMRAAAFAAEEAMGAAREARLFVRRAKWRRKVNADLLANIDDPREAAAAMMIAVAQHDGLLSDKEQHAIRSLIVRYFAVDAAKTEEFVVRGRWHARQVSDLAQFLRRSAPPILRACSEDERLELIDMLEAAASVDGPIDAIAAGAIDRLRHHLGV